ncbi:MAG TPA: flagellar basal body L-ring protein FlgH [Planctomycetota bacterium]|nr:flagellar basal body L-ring protein FlgH [Planctomycetota bacterium]
MSGRQGLAALAAVLLAVTRTWAGEAFWQDARVSETAFTTTRAMPTRSFKKYDIITVVITEDSKASGKGNLERSKDMSKSFAVNDWARLVKRNGGYTLRPALTEDGTKIVPTWDLEYAEDDSREGTIGRQDKFTARVAAVVRDVKPNGNLVIEAQSLIYLQRERREITLTGMVRSEDVRPDNTVPSYCIAMAEIRYVTEGPASDGARRGWLTAVFDFINPF